MSCQGRAASMVGLRGRPTSSPNRNIKIRPADAAKAAARAGLGRAASGSASPSQAGRGSLRLSPLPLRGSMRGRTHSSSALVAASCVSPSCQGDASDGAPGQGDSNLRGEPCDLILEAYRDAMFHSKTGRDELSRHNKYHFCVRWHRLCGDAIPRMDSECAKGHIAAYIDPVIRSLGEVTLLKCSPDIRRWTSTELALAITFMRKHEVGKPHAESQSITRFSSDKCDELRVRFLFTLAYWLQKLDDHGLLNFPDYQRFVRWALKVCENSFHPAIENEIEMLSLQPRLGMWTVQLTHILAMEPVKVINTIYTMQRLGICPPDITAFDLWRIFQQVWAPVLRPASHRFKDYCYGLTHFVLNESNFYQDLICLQARTEDLREAIVWILDFFNSQLPSILAFEDPDLAGEVALCFLLCGRSADKHDWRSCESCIGLIQRCLRTDTGSVLSNGKCPQYVFRNASCGKTRGIKAEEHTNAVCLLALGLWSRRSSSSVSYLCSHAGPLFSHHEWN